MLWSGFVKRTLRKEHTPEGSIFWKALKKMTPNLAAESHMVFTLGEQEIRHEHDAKHDVVEACRTFLCDVVDKSCIRDLAMRLGYLPGDVQDSVYEDYDGTKSVRDEKGCVKGTRIKFPDDGPDCEYEALFDKRPMFDALRMAFLVYGDPMSTASTFIRLLREGGIAEHNDFISCLERWIRATARDLVRKSTLLFLCYILMVRLG